MSPSLRAVRLRRRPRGMLVAGDLELIDVPFADPCSDEVAVRNVYMAVDAFTRSRLDASSPLALDVGEVVCGPAIGEVVRSRAAGVPEGAVVVHDLGWRDVAVVNAAHVRRVEPGAESLSAHLGVLGRPGEVAHGALHDLIAAKPGDVVLISTAAGAVGTVAVQLAKRRGLRVIGITGSEAKATFLVDELGIDGVAVHSAGNLNESLVALAPDGVDVYLDLVGGRQLEAALSLLRPGGRVAVCGQVAGYNTAWPLPGPRNLLQVALKGITVRGIGAVDFDARRRTFLEDIVPALASGEVRNVETVVNGLDGAPSAMVGLLRGENVGRMVVALP